MKIIYKQNPLQSIIILDENEKTKMKYSIKINELTDRMFSAKYELTKSIPDVQCAIDELDLKDIETETQRQYGYLLESLQHSHIGDCTAFPCSCTKCQAEDVLQINTIRGLGKHGGSSLVGFFDKSPQATMSDFIDYITHRTYEKTSSWNHYTDSDFAKLVDGWKIKSQHLVEWCKKYKEDYLNE